MSAYKHISKIIIALMAVAVILCLLAVAYSSKLTEMFGGTGVTMEYESKLFDRDEIIEIDIQMDEDEWDKMLTHVMTEEYYACNVVVNGKRVNNVAIRPKGNTSLSAIAMDPNSDRYSLKLEFDHFVDGQTCYGLDKLILNNNYADATNMKEAVIYDMYQYIGATASLYNYAKVSVNGEYWGVYLALEGVEQSFMLRNFGTQDGELYKPDTMEMGGGNDSSSDSAAPSMDFSNFDFSGVEHPDSGDMTPPSGAEGFSFDPGNMPEGVPGGGDFSFDPSNMPEGAPGGGDFSFDPSNMPQGTPEGGDFSFDPNNMPEGTPGDGDFSFDPNNMPDGTPEGDASESSKGSSDSNQKPGASSGNDTSETSKGSSKPGMRPGGGGKGGFSMNNGGANLNYSDDELDSYSTIWEGEITKTGKSDHRKVVTALKNINEGTDLETYLNVDNVLKYMAVHTFAVNMDSLSGSMSHNYYLYEYNGQLDIFPWDYNLSFGGMSMGSDGDATEVVNDAIDTPFSGTRFFDALLSNEEYLEKYHAYLRQLVDEYVNGGRFDEVYDQIRSQIDPLVETDPTAFYSNEEYQNAADLLYDTIKLRAESIDGQLNGTIPSTDDGQREDSSALIDASHIDVKAMGEFNMGGFSSRSDSDDTTASDEKTDINDMSGSNGNTGTENTNNENMPGSGVSSDKPDPGNMAGGSFPGFGNSDKRPSSFSGMPGQSSAQSKMKNLTTYGICLLVMIVALVVLSFVKRRK